MACGGCNDSTGLTKDQVENLINKMVAEGVLSASLFACDGSKLPAGAKLVVCDQLASIVNERINNGQIKVVKTVEFVDGKLVVMDGDGTTHKIEMPFVKGVEVAGKVQLTLANGKEVIIPSDAISESDLGKTIKKGIREDNKFDIDVGALAKENTEPNNAFNQAGSGLANDGQGGLKVVPADFIDNDTIVVDPTTGRIKVKPHTCVDMTNGNLNTLSNGLNTLGQTCYYGLVAGALDTTSTNFIVGVPADPANATLTHTTAAETKADLNFGTADVTGYQIASPTEIIQYFYDDYSILPSIQNSGWVRMHTGGLNNDGTLKNGSWTRWERNGAIPDPDGGLSALAARVRAIEDSRNQPCTVSCKHLSDGQDYIVTPYDEFITSSGGKIIVNAETLLVGTQFTVVQTTSNAVTIEKAGNTTIHAPHKGTLKLAGKNAVVTIMRELNNNVRVFGQTEPLA